MFGWSRETSSFLSFGYMRLVFILTKVHIHTDIFTQVQTFTQPSPPPSPRGFSKLDNSVLLSSSALTSTYHVTPCLQSQHCNGKLRTFFHRNFSFTKMIFWLIKILHITYVKYYINNSEQQILYILHFRLRTANLTFRFQFQFIWLVLVLWWQFPFINFLFV